MPGSSNCFGSWITSSHFGVMAPGDSDSGNSLVASAGSESPDRRLAVCVGAYTSSDAYGRHLLFAAMLRRRYDVRTSSEVASSFGTARWMRDGSASAPLVDAGDVEVRGLPRTGASPSRSFLRIDALVSDASVSVSVVFRPRPWSSVPILVVGAWGLRVSLQRWLRLMLDLDFGPGCSSFGSGARSNDGPRRSASAGFLTRCSSSVQLSNRLVRLGSRTVACDPCALRCTCTAHFGVSVDSGRQTEHDTRGACTRLRALRWT